MRSSIFKAGLLVALFIAAVSAFSQEFPPPREMVLGRKFFVAFGKQVRDELKITDAQFKKMQDAFEGAIQIEGDRVMIMMTPDVDLNSMEKKAFEALDEPQKKRLDEVWLNITGAIAAADDKIGRTLNITDDQKKQINLIVGDTAKALQDLYSDGNHDESTVKKGREIRQKASEKALALLTDEQKKTFETLKGKPFKLQPDKPGL